MKYINEYEFFTEAVNFFEKNKFWSINGKKVKVVGSIPQNQQVLKLQEVDESGKPIGKMFVGKKGDIKGWKQTKSEETTKDKFKVGEEAHYKIGTNSYTVRVKKILPNEKIEIEHEYKDGPDIPNVVDLSELMNKSDMEEKDLEMSKSSASEKEPEKPTEESEVKPEVKDRYKELVTAWKVQQKKLGKNDSPGQGTRTRLMKQAESELNFDETNDIEGDLKNLKRTTAYDAVDRLSNLLKAQKVKKPENVLKYLDFIKSKLNTGNVTKPSLN